MVSPHAIRGSLQTGFRAAGAVNQAQGRLNACAARFSRCWGAVEWRGSVCHVDQCRCPVRRNIEALSKPSGEHSQELNFQSAIARYRRFRVSNSAHTKPIERVPAQQWINLNSSIAQTSSGIKICWRLQSMRPSGEQYKDCSPKKKQSNPSTILLRGAPAGSKHLYRAPRKIASGHRIANQIQCADG
jgi:hypothetical protein